MKNYPSEDMVVITDSFEDDAHRAMYADVDTNSKRFGWNQDLPPNSRGTYIGGEEGKTYTMFIMIKDGSIIPFPRIKPGIVHPICPRQIIYNSDYHTTAPNIIVMY